MPGLDMDMGSMSAHGGGMADSTTGAACKINMLWNWYTVNACFISSSWHVRSKAGFAGTVIGVYFIVVVLEAFRRIGRDYDRAIKKAYYASAGCAGASKEVIRPFQPTFAQHLVRSVFYGVQFATGYMLMLMAMYYNGFIIFAIFLGAFTGYLLTARDTVAEFEAPGVRGDCCA